MGGGLLWSKIQNPLTDERATHGKYWQLERTSDRKVFIFQYTTLVSLCLVSMGTLTLCWRAPVFSRHCVYCVSEAKSKCEKEINQDIFLS